MYTLIDSVMLVQKVESQGMISIIRIIHNQFVCSLERLKQNDSSQFFVLFCILASFIPTVWEMKQANKQKLARKKNLNRFCFYRQEWVGQTIVNSRFE